MQIWQAPLSKENNPRTQVTCKWSCATVSQKLTQPWYFVTQK